MEIISRKIGFVLKPKKQQISVNLVENNKAASKNNVPFYQLRSHRKASFSISCLNDEDNSNENGRTQTHEEKENKQTTPVLTRRRLKQHGSSGGGTLDKKTTNSLAMPKYSASVPGSPNPGQKNKKKPKSSQTSKVADITTIRAAEKLRQSQRLEEQKLLKKQQRREIYVLNKIMTEWEHKNFAEFCKQNEIPCDELS